MTQLGIPYSRNEIVTALSAETDLVHDFFTAIPPEQFFTSPSNEWSPAENLVHLIKSCAPVAVGLKAPKIFLRLRFGLAKRNSRSLGKVVRDYQATLEDGGEAGGDYLPLVETTTDAERERILAKWREIGERVVAGMGKWSEKQLDKYAVVHPLLGQMTVREIMFFTLYHNMHHINQVSDLLGKDQVAWFDRVSTFRKL